MRYLFPALILPATLGGCATGYASDWFKDRNTILAPELARYGLDQAQSACVGERLSRRLSRGQLRQFQLQAAAAARRPASGTLTILNLRSAALAMQDKEIGKELDSVANLCKVPLSPVRLAASAAPAPDALVAAFERRAAPDGSAAGDGGAKPGGTQIAATWLNLGAAESGQSLAIDAMSIQQDGASRIAWFRMTDAESGGVAKSNYRLRIDCEAKTVQPLALRQLDAVGAQTSLREYTPEEAAPGPALSGTVLEIAYLSLCT